LPEIIYHTYFAMYLTYSIILNSQLRHSSRFTRDSIITKQALIINTF